MPRGRSNSGDGGISRYNLGSTGNGRAFCITDADSELFISAIGAVLGNGDAVLFSLTSDGGALSIRLYSDGSKQAVYCSDQAELEVVLNTLKATNLD